MTCPECQGQLVHIVNSSVWMCEECPYAATDEYLNTAQLRSPIEIPPGVYEHMQEDRNWPRWHINQTGDPVQTNRNGGTVEWHSEG